MVGANRSICGYSSSRRKFGVAILEVPQEDVKWSSNRRNSIVRVVDKSVAGKASRETIMKRVFSSAIDIILKIGL